VNICENCGQEQNHFCEARDENRGGKGRFSYYKCGACGLISQPVPPQDLGSYYSEDYYTIPDSSVLTRLANREDCKVDAFKHFTTGSRLLEIGSAFGVFAFRAKQEGFTVTVIERDFNCCRFLEKEVGVEVIQADDPDVKLKTLPPFDVIVLWQVIEHLSEPFTFIDSAAKNLVPGGILALSTPNPESFQFGLMGKAWPHLDAPRHLFLIPASVFINRFTLLGLEVCHLVSDDADARSWNRFGWQRLIMNRLPGRIGDGIGFFLGWALSLCTWWPESKRLRGSTFTLVLRKKIV